MHFCLPRLSVFWYSVTVISLGKKPCSVRCRVSSSVGFHSTIGWIHRLGRELRPSSLLCYCFAALTVGKVCGLLLGQNTPKPMRAHGQGWLRLSHKKQGPPSWRMWLWGNKWPCRGAGVASRSWGPHSDALVNSCKNWFFQYVYSVGSCRRAQPNGRHWDSKQRSPARGNWEIVNVSCFKAQCTN